MNTVELDRVFHALADPTRRTIVARLAKGPQTVAEIAAPFSMSGPAITKHLKVLENAGLVKTEKQAQTRPRTLVAEPLREAVSWIESTRYMWEDSLDRLEALLKETP